MDGQAIMNSCKTRTTPQVLDGIKIALQNLLKNDNPSSIQSIMLGTTHFANALVEGKQLEKTAVIRLGFPYGQSIPPFVDFPEQLKNHIQGLSYILPGGHEVDGRAITEFDEDKVKSAANEIKQQGIKSVAVSSPFSPVDQQFEIETANILNEIIPDVQLTTSSEIGSVGLLERENAAILNASLLTLADSIIDKLQEAFIQLGLNCPFYLTQNDGTLMNVDFAKKYPVLTISSSPTNSMRGAAYLSKKQDALVVDVGGTTADVGVVINGFPRAAANVTEISGVRTNFRMPDVYSLGLGGGTIVNWKKTDSNKLSIGPRSTGNNIQNMAYIFGGSTLTMTDVIVASGKQNIGSPEKIPMTKEEATNILKHAENMVSAIVDRMKPSKDKLPAILVGGGAIIISQLEEGISEMIHPEYSSVANAIGAAISQ